MLPGPGKTVPSTPDNKLNKITTTKQQINVIYQIFIFNNNGDLPTSAMYISAYFASKNIYDYLMYSVMLKMNSQLHLLTATAEKLIHLNPSSIK